MKFKYTNVKTGQIEEAYIDDAWARKLEEYIDFAEKTNGDFRLIVGGETGSGKTTFIANACKYLESKTKREYNVNNIYFIPDDYARDSVTTSERILHNDESAFALLASEWNTNIQKLLIKTAMVDRKKKHYHFLALPAFEKLKDYLALDRSIGLVHCYKRNGKEIGHFLFFNKKAKERLYKEWKRTGILNYEKHHTIHGTFPNNLYKLIDEEAYESKKDRAILSLADKGNPVVNKEGAELTELKRKISLLHNNFNITQQDLAKYLEVNPRTIRRWQLADKNDVFSKENEVLEGLGQSDILELKGEE